MILMSRANSTVGLARSSIEIDNIPRDISDRCRGRVGIRDPEVGDRATGGIPLSGDTPHLATVTGHELERRHL